jgi:hypothetical protein
MPFKYLRDPLFVFCVVLYFINRWWLKPLFPGGFFSYYLNDLICIPFWVPIMVWGMHKLGLRDNDSPPQWDEILIPLLMWSALFEIWLPQTRIFMHLAHSDPIDILAYATGACLATLFWNRHYRCRTEHGTTFSSDIPTRYT